MSDLYKKGGQYYGGIQDGLDSWKYGMDKERVKEELLSYEKYRERRCYGLNGDEGVDIMGEEMDVESSEEVVSFGDVYGVMK